MNDVPESGNASGVQLSVVAGIFATVGSLFGKLAGGVEFSSVASSMIKLLLLVAMVAFNTVGCTLFVKGLQGSDSSLPATVLSAATNYFFSALVGFIIFGESTSLMWWCGTSLVLLGLIIICCTPARKTMKTSKEKKQ